jgi:hypothetical protein
MELRRIRDSACSALGFAGMGVSMGLRRRFKLLEALVWMTFSGLACWWALWLLTH